MDRIGLTCVLACLLIHISLASAGWRLGFLQPGRREDALEKKHHRHHSPPAPAYPSYPYAPTGGGYVAPPTQADVLPFTSGMIVNLRSHVLHLECNVGPTTEQPVHALRCSEAGSSPVYKALLMVGEDYTTNVQLVDGSRIFIKSQRENTLCGVGKEEDGYPIVCNQPYSTEATSFIIRRAKARDDLFYIAPASMPDNKCYPAHAQADHGLQLAQGVMDSAEAQAQHIMRCDGGHRGDNYLLHIEQASYYAGDAGDSAVSQGKWMYPYAPDAPGAAPPGPKSDILPFSTGSIIRLRDRHMGAYVCDTQDNDTPGGGGYGPGGGDKGPDALSSKKHKKHKKKKHDDDDDDKKKKEDTQPVWCDRKAPEGPGSEYIPSGFLVQAEDPAVRELHSGAAIYLSSQNTHKMCRPTDRKDDADPGVICDGGDKGPGTKFRAFLVKKHRRGHDDEAENDDDVKQSFWSAALSWLKWKVALSRAHAAGEEAEEGLEVELGTGPVDGEVEIYLLHVDTNRWCGADWKHKHAPLVCDFKRKRRRKLILKPSKW